MKSMQDTVHRPRSRNDRFYLHCISRFANFDIIIISMPMSVFRGNAMGAVAPVPAVLGGTQFWDV